MSPSPSLSSALSKLAQYRSNNTRASQETFEAGLVIINSKSWVNQLGDEAWAFLEQLTLAAIDVGRLDVADECLKRLSNQFPKSPRVEVLTGIRIESTESEEVVWKYYQELLDEDPTNVAVWKRRIAVLRRSGKYDKAVEQLSQYLDTFYADLEGWLELADIYSHCQQYTHALQSLTHALLISPQNPFTHLQFAETAYTANDIPLALKMFLLVIDMDSNDHEMKTNDPPMGIQIRAWMGIKQCTRRLMASSPKLDTSASVSSSASNTPVPNRLELIDELATERVLAAYRTEQRDGVMRKYVAEWLCPR